MQQAIPGFLFGLFLVVFPGTSPAQSDPATYPGAMICIGKGGGFAGTVREYRLLDNGRLYRKEPGSNAFRQVRKKSKKKTLRWFYDLERTGLRCMDYQHPGNIYQFVGLKDKGIDNRVTWGSNDQEVPPAITDFYSRFMVYWVK